MGSWRVSADLLASSRFVLSPMAETVAALTVLEAPKGPWQQVFHAANRDAFDEMMARHPVRRDLVRRAWRPRRGDQPGWVADFLGTVPAGPGVPPRGPRPCCPSRSIPTARGWRGTGPAATPSSIPSPARSPPLLPRTPPRWPG